MFDYNAPLFWYKLIFIMELIVAEGFATYSLTKRDHFAWRVVGGIAFLLLVAFLFPVYFSDPVSNTLTVSAMFLFLFSASVAVMKFCYDEKLVTLFFCGVVAYTTQHLAYSTYQYLLDITGIGIYNLYGETYVEVNSPILSVVYFGVYAIIYWFVWAFVEHRIREQEKLRIEPLLLFSFAGILFVDVILSIIVTYMMESELSKIGQTVVYLYRLSSGLFIYVMLYCELGKHLAEVELETVESLWRQDKRSYELSRENIEQINIKCHDLKHQIRKLRTAASNGVIDEAFLTELEKSVTIYDQSIKTGNEAVDLIIAENSIFMAAHQIKLSVIADGAQLDFMPSTDIYSLFGNALHNAQEAVCRVKDTEKRIIRMHIRNEARMVIIHVENYAEQVTFGVDGLPLTNKSEGGHGYGVRSMRMIAEKYGGLLTTAIEDSLFCLDIILPIPANEEQKK